MNRYNLLLLLFVSAFTINFIGCAPSQLKPRERMMVYDILDFRDYSQKNFMFTVAEYQGDFESLSYLDLTFIPEMKTTIADKEISDYDRKYIDNKFLYVQKLSPKNILDLTYNYCIKIGADALTEFKLELKGYKDPEYGIYFSAYTVTGFAIRRKQ